MSAPRVETFQCAMCDGVYENCRPEEEVEAEYVEAFGPGAINEPRAVVCDDCYLIMCPGGKPIQPS